MDKWFIEKSHEKLNENCVMLSIEDDLSQYGIDNQTRSLHKIDGILKKEDLNILFDHAIFFRILYN